MREKTLIQTSRLFIRLFQEQDSNDLYEYLSDPSVYRFEPGKPISREEAKEICIRRSQGPSFWAVVLQNTQKMVGHLFFAQTEPVDFLTWELGYIFNPRFHNQGYATESSLALIHYGFLHMGIHRVVAHCNPQNIASCRVLEKIGMRKEGHFRKNVTFHKAADGSPIWNDSYEFAILEEELMPVKGSRS
jgi:RimJ/RimL family protein N-acetyltransferase